MYNFWSYLLNSSWFSFIDMIQKALIIDVFAILFIRVSFACVELEYWEPENFNGADIKFIYF